MRRMKLPVKVEKRPLDPETAAYANEVADRLRTTLGDDLVGVYLHGSAVLGDFSRDHSDIDIVAVTEDSLSDDQKRAIAEQLSSTSLPLPVHELEFHLVRRQSISGTVDAPAFELHLTNGASNRVVDGEGHHGDPDLVMHFAVLAEHGQALLGPPASQIFPRVGRERLIRAFARELKWAKEHASPSYQVLNAARAWQFLETGAIASKLEGGAWAGGHVRDTSTIDAALQHRRGMTDSDDHWS